MKINTENTTEAIKKVKPNLKDNSIKQYEIHLNKLKKLFESDSYDFLSNPDEVMEKLSDKHYTSQRNTLNAIIILLLALNSDNKFDKLIEEYQKIRDSKISNILMTMLMARSANPRNRTLLSLVKFKK